MLMTSSVDFVTWLQVLSVTVGIATSITIPSNQQSSQANLQTNGNGNLLPESSISSSDLPNSSKYLLATFSHTDFPTSTFTESSINFDATRETDAPSNQTRSQEIEYEATAQQNQPSMTNAPTIDDVLLLDTSNSSSTQHLQTSAFYGIVERLRNVIFPTTSSTTLAGFSYSETVLDRNIDERQQSDIFATSLPSGGDDDQTAIPSGEHSTSTPEPSYDYLGGEDDLRRELMKVFREKTAKIKLKPSFMVSLIWDMLQHYNSSSSSSELSSGSEESGEDTNHQASEDKLLKGDTASEIGYVYPDDDDDEVTESEIENDHDSSENRYEEYDGDDNDESDDKDVHEKFHDLTYKLIGQFNQHSHKFDDDGHKKFLDFVLLVFHRHDGNNNPIDVDISRPYDLKKKNRPKIDAVRMKLKLNKLIRNLESNNLKQTDSPLGVHEDAHGIIKQVIKLFTSDQHEIADCVHQCLVSVDRTVELHRNRFVRPSKEFLSRWNLTIDNWQQEIKMYSYLTNNDKRLINESQQCCYPSLETEPVHNHRYIAPPAPVPDPDRGSDFSIVVGERHGKIVPDYVYVYRCRNRYGCCSRANDTEGVKRVCDARKRDFFLRVLTEVSEWTENELVQTNSTPRLYRFYDDTECYCKVLSKNDQKCSSYYEFVNDDVSNTTCRCVKDSVHYNSCRSVMNGTKKVSASDSRCIRMGKCVTPACSDGSYDREKESCPRAKPRGSRAPSGE